MLYKGTTGLPMLVIAVVAHFLSASIAHAAAAGPATRPVRRALIVTAVAADGALLTLPGAPQTEPSTNTKPTNVVVANAAAPIITPAPGTDPDWNGGGAKFVQTTYYSCVTRGTYSHCGWHEPILDASSAGSGGWGAGAALPAMLWGIVATVWVWL